MSPTNNERPEPTEQQKDFLNKWLGESPEQKHIKELETEVVQKDNAVNAAVTTITNLSQMVRQLEAKLTAAKATWCAECRIFDDLREKAKKWDMLQDDYVGTGYDEVDYVVDKIIAALKAQEVKV